MEDQELQKIIEERMVLLPKLVQDSINSMEWQEVVRSIVEQNNLRIDQGGAIETEVVLAMLGITEPEDFTKHLTTTGHLEKELAEKITGEVEVKIFKEIRNLIATNIEKRDSEPKREDVLKDIEDEPREYSREAAPQVKEVKTTTPENLPTGDIKNVPKHGHDHQKETNPLEKNLKEVVSSPKEDVDFSVRNIDKAMKKTDNKPTVDPYREAIN